MASRRRRVFAVTFISAGTLAYEILLVRVFAIEQFHHFAHMAIGVAMLGFGVAGTWLAVIRQPSEDTANSWFSLACWLTPMLLIAAPTLALRIPLDATQLAWEPTQWYRLGAVYVLLALPFASGAAAILIGLTREPIRPGMVYGASFAGSALGATLALAALWIVRPAGTLAVPPLIAAAGALFASPRGRRGWALAAAAPVAAVLAMLAPPWTISVSQYKSLPQVESFPNAQRIAERSSPMGWLVAVGAPAFRFAPGLSLGFQDSFPAQVGLFLDGHISGAIHTDGLPSLFDWLPTAAPYAVRRASDVLILGAGGGTEIRNAVTHGASQITAVELHPDVADLVHTSLENDSLAHSVSWILGDIRSFVARSGRRYDLVALAPSGGFGASAAGVHSLQEDFLHTVDAYVSYLRLLEDEGILAITRWISIPNRASARTVLTAAAALRTVAPNRVADGLVVARSWGTATVLVKPSGFSALELGSLQEWANRRMFDLDWYPGSDSVVTRFHHVDDPVLVSAASAAIRGPEAVAQFAVEYPFDIAPVSDARPYPHHFLRLQSLGFVLGRDRGSSLPFAEWGPIGLTATLAQSTVAAILLLILPAALHGRRRRGSSWSTLAGYFFAIGFAYLAAEIAAIQQISLLLGHPVFAFTTVLTSFLLFSGAGSVVSDRIRSSNAWILACLIAVGLALSAVLLLDFVHTLQGAHIVVRLIIAIVSLAPIAFLMGMPFPTGLRAMATDDAGRVAWAWAANGFASVISAPLAALIALQAGSRWLLASAAVAYAMAAVLARAYGGNVNNLEECSTS